MKKFLRYLAALAALAVATSAMAQSAATGIGESAAADSAKAADEPVVSLITCYPGQNIYELYGHTELRVRGSGYDWVFNYGTFDFRAPNFIYRFVKGETDYMLAGYPSSYMLVGYERRKVVEQVRCAMPSSVVLSPKTAPTATIMCSTIAPPVRATSWRLPWVRRCNIRQCPPDLRFAA